MIHMTKDFEFVKEIVDETDWDEMRNRRAELQSILDSPVRFHLTQTQIDAIDGIVEHIAHLQSLVVSLDFCTEEEVYGKKKEG